MSNGGQDSVERHDVVVVGGGISGLATAWHLRDRDVLVLEASERVGGRVYSVPREDTWLNFGAHVYGGVGTATDRLLRGLDVWDPPLPGKLAALSFGGRLITTPVETYPFLLPLSLKSRAALVKVGLKLRYDVMRYDKVYALRPDETPAQRQARVVNFMDDVSFSQHMGPMPEDVDAMFRCTLTRSTGEPEELAAGYGVGYFHLVWKRDVGLSRAIMGGPQTIIDRLVPMLPHVETNARVTSVEENADGVRVVVETASGRREIEATAAVVGTIAPVTADIVKGLPADTESALRQVHYGKYALGGILVDGKAPLPWDNLYAIATPGRSFAMAYNIGNVQHQPGLPRPAHGSVMVYSAASAGARLLQEDDETIARRFRDDLCAVFPEVTRRIEDVVIHRWERGTPFAHVGRGKLQPALTKELGRVHLVGDYLGTKYIETCCDTAELAAARIRKQL